MQSHRMYLKGNRLGPRLLYSDNDGVVRDHPFLLALGDGGGEPVALREAGTVSLPRGSDLFMLPGRSPRGRDPQSGELITVAADEAGNRVHAVAAFLAPAHTATLLASYTARPQAPSLQ